MNSFPSMMMNNGPLSNAVVIHRQLSCIDESATDEEQQDKILYYYPEDTPLYQQLSKVTMLEGLIEFSGKFSSEPIQSVVMDNTTWVFCNCEKDFWIILGISNKYCPPSGAIDELFIQTPSDMGLYEIVCRMYGLYTTFFPRINNSLANQNGWHIIQRVQSFRKAIRKQRLILKQQYQDKKCLEDRKEEEHEEDLSESLGIQRNKTTCEDLDRDIAGTKKAILDFTKQLENELMNYPVRLVRESLSRYLRWFLFSGECFNPSGYCYCYIAISVIIGVITIFTVIIVIIYVSISLYFYLCMHSHFGFFFRFSWFDWSSLFICGISCHASFGSSATFLGSFATRSRLW